MYLERQHQEKNYETQGKNDNTDVMLWLGVGLSFLMSAPLGFLLLFLKLFGIKNCMQGVKEIMSPKPKAEKKRKQGETWAKNKYVYQESGLSGLIHDVKRDFTLQQHKKFVAKKLRGYGEEEKVIGGVLAVVFGSGFLSGLESGEVSVAVASFAIASGGVFFHGLHKGKRGKRMLEYLGIIGSHTQFSTQTLSQMSGVSLSKVHGDVSEMIAMGVFQHGFLDRSQGVLVLGEGEAYLEQNAEKEEEAQVAREEHDVLKEIRQIPIQNKKVKAQVEHIAMITGKILDYQEEHENRGELHSFLSYYLPTTLKLLRSYSQLEEQNIEGSHISKAKEQIEDMMDKIVEGFEKQLDQLFQRDTMDIATDISVLEQMMEKDGFLGDVFE